MNITSAWATFREAVDAWLQDKAMRLAASLAFYSLLSIAPLLVVSLAVAGLVFDRDAATGALAAQLRGLVGDAGAEVVQTTVRSASEPGEGAFAALLGIAALLFGASGVFGELQDALNTAWGVQPKPGRPVWTIVRERFLSFGMVLVVGFLLLVSMAASAALQGMSGYLARFAAGLPALLGVLNFVVSFAVVTVLFALIFRVLPDGRIASREMWFGALVTAVLFTIGKYLIGLYLGRAAVGTPYGAAGSLVAFIVWVYYSGLILLFGAELTKVVARRSGRPIEPTPNAMAVAA